MSQTDKVKSPKSVDAFPSATEGGAGRCSSDPDPRQFPGLNRQGDPFDLTRFLAAQEPIYGSALAELRRGRKESHWMWFVFPQVAGLGSSPTSRRFAIRSKEEAGAYLEHPVLGLRLLECCQALLSLTGRSASEIMGNPDDLKLQSSMTLFAVVAPSRAEFRDVLAKYFGGMEDPRTVALLRSPP